MSFHNGLIVISVGSRKQKLLCEKLLLSLDNASGYEIKVISDDEQGYRLGSGGAVLNILRNYYREKRKLIIVNSGGMSKRSINYALRGKAFSNILIDNNIVCLLKLILSNAQKLIENTESGTLICCSDILVQFDKAYEGAQGNFGVGIRADFETASRHGVMLCDEKGEMSEYLHKYSAEKLEKIAAEKNLDSMLIDSGITYFSDEFSQQLSDFVSEKNITDLISSHNFEIGLYSDIVKLLSRNISENEYLEEETENEQHSEFKKMLYKRFCGCSMQVFQAEEQRFLHFGSTSEAIENLFYLSGYRVQNLLLNSYADGSSEVGEGTVLENVQLNCCRIGRNCFVSDVSLENAVIRDSCAVCGIKLLDGSFVTIISDLNENPKKLEGEKTIWDTPRYYPAESFSVSLEKFYNNCDEERYSMAYCTENADFDYCFSRQQFLKDMQDYSVSADYLRKREEIISHHFKKQGVLEKVKCEKDRVEVNLPLRVNLSGTWTDAMPYCVDNGGQVVNMAVRVDGQKPVRVIVEKLEKTGVIEFSSESATAVFDFHKNDKDGDLSDFELHKAALIAMGFTADTEITHGFRLTTEVENIDKGSGLGTSSILLGGCFKALSEMFSLECDESRMLKMVFVAEQIMKTGGGWQDQVGGLTPGIKAGTTVSGIEQELDVSYILLSDFFKRIFSEKLILLSTGQRHFGRFIVNDVVNRYLEGNPESVEGHIKIRQLNDDLIDSLKNDNYEGFVSCVNRHRELLRLISPKVTNKEIEKMVSKCLEKADAVSYLGAGGGGYLLVVLNNETDIDSFRQFAQRNFMSKPSQVKKLDICYDI